MPAELDDLTSLSARSSATGLPAAGRGAAGTGKTVALVRRHAWLATAGGLAAEQILGIAPSEGAADTMRAAVEDALDAGYEELAVDTVPGLCARAAARRGARGGDRPVRACPSAAPTAW